jgi:hypothetical protein
METKALAESIRVLAHQACKDSLKPVNPYFSPECMALIRAEEAFAPKAILPVGIQSFYVYPNGFQPAPTAPSAIHLRADAVPFVRPTTISLRHEIICKNNADCSPGSICFAGGACSLPPPAVPASNSLLQYFKALDDDIETREALCENAEFYVTPSGALVHHPDAKPADRDRLCIDAALYSIDRPFEVEITEYWFESLKKYSPVKKCPPAEKGSPVETQIVTLFPGETKMLGHLHRSSVVRVTVRGYPSGASLRALALEGTNHVLTTMGASDLVVAQSAAADQREIYQAKVATVSALNRLANAVVGDATFSSGIKAMEAAITAAAKPTIAAADLELARQKTLAAAQAFSAALARFVAEATPGDALATSQAVNLAQALMVSVPGPVAPAAPAKALSPGRLAAGLDGLATLQD